MELPYELVEPFLPFHPSRHGRQRVGQRLGCAIRPLWLVQRYGDVRMAAGSWATRIHWRRALALIADGWPADVVQAALTLVVVVGLRPGTRPVMVTCYYRAGIRMK